MEERAKQYRLKCDVLSNYTDKRGKPIIYGKMREKVTEVADHVDVIIVANSNGQLFPVAKDKLTEL